MDGGSVEEARDSRAKAELREKAVESQDKKGCWKGSREWLGIKGQGCRYPTTDSLNTNYCRN